jgi:DHA1 family multidrug resistance protein-like MFS transporter
MSSHSIIRDSTFGLLLRLATGNKILKYAEELDTFECPDTYAPGGFDTPAGLGDATKEKEAEVAASRSRSRTSSDSASKNELAQIPTADPDDLHSRGPHLEGIRSTQTRSQSARIIRSQSFDRQNTQITQHELDQAVTAAFAGPQPSRPVIPDKLEDGTVLVDWYTTDDPENPQNWPYRKKLFVTCLIG